MDFDVFFRLFCGVPMLIVSIGLSVLCLLGVAASFRRDNMDVDK